MAVHKTTIHPFLVQGFHLCPDCDYGLATGSCIDGAPTSCQQCEALKKLRACAALLRILPEEGQ
jgi:hypothetical protein